MPPHSPTPYRFSLVKCVAVTYRYRYNTLYMKSQYVLPFTIVIAGALIAGAVFLVSKSGVNPPQTGEQGTNVRAYDPAIDHIVGNPNAPVKVIEYMDLECPYCKVFHTTMHQIMDHYGQNGQVAWVVRHMPLVQLHSKALQEHLAAECAAAQGGDTAFFRYIDRVFEVTPSSNGLDLAQLPVIAGELGLNVEAFNQCVSDGTYTRKIQDQYSEALAAGAQGTPYTLLMIGTDSVVLPGAQPYDSMRAAIDAVLGNLPLTIPEPSGTTTQ